jgi:hypothetical protein
MPLSVRVAVATACVIALLGVASIVVWAGDLLTRGSVSAALGTHAFGSLVSPLFVLGAAVPMAAVNSGPRSTSRF